MATDHEKPKLLILSLYEDDDPEDVFCKGVMQSLVDGTRAPSDAAAALDAWVVGESSRRLQEQRRQPDLLERDDEGNIFRPSTPNASGYVDRFFQSFPNLCSVFPPYHAGQTRVIEFLKALRAMPEHQAPDYFPDGSNLDEVAMLTLWPEGVSYSTEYFRIGADAIRYSGSPINTPESEEAARWRNYQSTLARLTMADFSDCSFNSALRDIIPSEKTVPSKHLRVYTSRPEQFGGHITAAAQWVMYPEEASYVYGHCKRKKRVDKHNPRDTWSMENWEIWKSQFAYFSREDGVDARARETARKALESMETVESNIHRP